MDIARLCGSCGGSLDVGAGRCPRCGAAVQPNPPTATATGVWASPTLPSAPPAVRGVAVPMGAGWPTATPANPWQAQAPAARRQPTLVWAIAGGLLVSLLVIFGWRLLFGSKISFPDSIEGQPRMHGASVQRAEAQVGSIEVSGHRFQAAFYGSSTPSFVVVATDYPGGPEAEAAWTGFSSSFAGTSGAKIDETRTVRDQAGGASFICAPVVGRPGSVCEWADGTSTGFVLGLTDWDPASAMTRVRDVRAAVAGG